MTTVVDTQEGLEMYNLLRLKSALKLEVAAFNWASVANVASKDELNDSKLVTLVLNDPEATCKLDMLEELALIFALKELDKLEC